MKKRGNKQYLLKGGVVGHDGSNAGRPPDWLKEKCKKIVQDKKLVEFLADVASGKKINKTDVYDLTGKKVGESESSAAPKDRIHATEILLDRGFGKVLQDVRNVDDDGKAVPYSIVIKTVNPNDGKNT